ncbi:hypothetical protein PAHAL_5G065300 [Panicum hallii]|uniref:KIB1-4 beta-propeller domain-containing protein n=1 Tax=Panicum hallii TaxID=206008 RepID=A0A2S3HP97_9POAL|nr:hypothetical protein PAHAL_5G065300 [Panicum hallii]
MEESTNAPAGAGNCPPLGTLPVLVYDHGRGPNNRQTAFAIGDESLHTSVVPELANNYYHATPHGWVLLVAPGPSPCTRLWDPRSGHGARAARGLRKPRFLYCRVGDSLWSVHEYDIGDEKLPPEYAPPRKLVSQQTAAVDGKFYFGETGKLGYIDRPCPEFPDGCNCLNEQLVESRGELFSVCICLKGFTPEILTVRVYRIDLMSGRPTLSKVDDLGDRVFLLSYTNGNRIYFNHNAMGDMDGGLLCVFDLDDQSLKTVRPCQEMAELLRNPFWMLPTDQDITREY